MMETQVRSLHPTKKQICNDKQLETHSPKHLNLSDLLQVMRIHHVNCPAIWETIFGELNASEKSVSIQLSKWPNKLQMLCSLT